MERKFEIPCLVDPTRICPETCPNHSATSASLSRAGNSMSKKLGREITEEDVVSAFRNPRHSALRKLLVSAEPGLVEGCEEHEKGSVHLPYVHL